MSTPGDTGEIRYDTTNVMADRVGPENGLSDAELAAIAPRVAGHHDALLAERKAGRLPFLDLPHARDTVDAIETFAASARGRFENLVVLGIGGSALGTIALHGALGHPFHNLLATEKRPGTRLFVADNIDPVLMQGLLDVIDPAETLFNVVTKSGETAETVSQLMLVTALLRDRLGSAWTDHVVATTDPVKGALRRIADSEGFVTFEVPEYVGGRFSVLSPVGLLPAALVGLDSRTLLTGAERMDARLQTGRLERNPAYLAAAVHYLLDSKHGKSIAVMMSYSHALRDVADWFRQLWAESLGKAKSLDDRTVHIGQTPVKAVGPTDQHSQVQLYVEGPADKMFTFLAVDEPAHDVGIPDEYPDVEACAYLGGRTFGELLAAERTGTAIALTESARPNATLTLPRLDPAALGALLLMLEVQTVMAGRLYNVNPFDQPGVEAGKVAAYALMGRKGHEKRRKEIEEASGHTQPRII